MTATATASQSSPRGKRTGGRGARPWLLMPKLFGLLVFLGGVSTMTIVGLFAPEPTTIEGWRAFRGILRTVVLGCMLPGVAIVVIFGALLLARHPRVFWPLRWFRLKLVMIAVCTPALHLWARGHTQRFDTAIERGDVAAAAEHWTAITLAFVVTLVIFCSIAAVGRLKPRLGEKFGSRRAS